MNHTLSDSQLEEMIKSAVNSSAPLPPDEKFSQLISALRELQERRKAMTRATELLSGVVLTDKENLIETIGRIRVVISGDYSDE
ncbi:hypothetical protein MBQ24_000122 [Klebsiella pneumoniae]|nr:hypothetical protein [Klebsiella pneumoniae]